MFWPIVIVLEADHEDTVDKLGAEFDERLRELFEGYSMVFYEPSEEMPMVSILGDYSGEYVEDPMQFEVTT